MTFVPTTSSGVPTQLNEMQIAALAYAAGFRGQGLADITAIALAESGGNTYAGVDGYLAGTHNSVGLTQINLNAHPQYTLDAMTNPLANLEAAYQISSGGTDFTPWTTFDTGAYTQFLPSAIQAANTITAHARDIAAGLNSGYSPIFATIGLGSDFAHWFSSLFSGISHANLGGLFLTPGDPALGSRLIQLGTGAVSSVVDPVVSGIEHILFGLIPWGRILEIVGGFALILVSLIGLVNSVSGGALGDVTKAAAVAGVAA